MKSSRSIRSIKSERASFWGKTLQNIGIILVSLGAFIAFWWLFSLYLNNSYLPAPDQVFKALIRSFIYPDPDLGIRMSQNIIASSIRFIEGFVLAFVIALPLGLLMGFLPRAEVFARPIVEVFRPIPPIAWVPFLFVVFGAIWNPIIAVFIGVFFPLLTNIILGVKSVDVNLLDVARTMGAGRLSLFSKIILPFSIPFLMTGVTIGMGVGWMCIVAAEWYGAIGGGVGYFILVQSNNGNYPMMFAGMIVIAGLGILTVTLSGYAEKAIRRRMGML